LQQPFFFHATKNPLLLQEKNQNNFCYTHRHSWDRERNKKNNRRRSL